MKWLLLFAACVCVGCSTNKGIGRTVSESDDLFPSTWKHAPVTLNLGGVEIDASVELESDGSKRELQVIGDGAVLDQEVYIVDAEGISLQLFGPSEGESYDPPLPLIRYATRIGETLEWSGKYRVADRSLSATAKCTTVIEQIPLATGPIEAIRCQIELQIDDTTKDKVKRGLTVWFAKGEGPVKRDFGKQVRTPRIVEK